MSKDHEISEARQFYIAKANEIVQKARYDLTITELKVLSYVFSMIKPTDTKDTEYIVDIKTYCKIAGIDATNHGNYVQIRNSLKRLRDKSFWITLEDGSDSLVGWLAKAKVNRGSGKVRVKLDEDLSRYLVNLTGNYFQYQFISILPMTSNASIILYELLKSYVFNHSSIEIPLEELRKKLNYEHKYLDFRDFKKRLEFHVKEINKYTDLEISYEKETYGKKVVGIIFYMKTKPHYSAVKTAMMNELLLNKDNIEGQIGLLDYLDSLDSIGEYKN